MQEQLASALPASRRRAPTLRRLDDERLARLVGAGRSDAFALLYERHHQQLYRYCRAILRDETEAQDALQSALAGALAALQRGQRNAPLRPWLFRIAHNEAISQLRRRRTPAEPSASEQPAAGSAEEQVETRARLAQLVADLQSLPERQRAALVMRELSGLSHAEIALALQATPRAVKQSIFDARQALAELAEGRAMACEKVQRAISDGDGRALRGRRLRAHLRDCATCAAFAAAIPARTTELRMLAPPLAPLAASALLAQLAPAGGVHGALGAGAAHGGGTALGAAASAGAGKTIGGALAVKTLAGVAIAAAVAAGVSTVLPRATHHRAGSGGAPTRRSSLGSSSSGQTPKRPSGRASGARDSVSAPARADEHGRRRAGETTRPVNGSSRAKAGLGAAGAGGHGAASRRSSSHARTRPTGHLQAPASGRGSAHRVSTPTRAPARSLEAPSRSKSASETSAQAHAEVVLPASPAPESPRSAHTPAIDASEPATR